MEMYAWHSSSNTWKGFVMSFSGTTVSGKLWMCPNFTGMKAVKVDGIPDTIVNIVRSRGIEEKELTDFFFPTIRNLMPNPSCLTDLDAIADVMSNAIMNNVRIGIIGDYDVDGATSVSEFALYCREISYDNVEYIIPQRLIDGYGPNPRAIQQLYDNGARVLLILDSGTIAYSAIEYARKLSMDVCVVDHHEPSETWLDNKPDALIINPKRPDDTSGLDTLCTAGLVIMLLTGLSRALVKKGYASKEQMPNIMNYMGLAGLGTVADIMELRGLNRAFVKAGLDRINATTGLYALTRAALFERVKDKQNIEFEEFVPAPRPYDFGFTIGPCINAGGRINDCMLGSNLLTEVSEEEALKQSRKLIAINSERQALQKTVQDEVIHQIETELLDENGDVKSNIVIAYNENWHPGVIGIVASKIRERYDCPAIIIGTDGKGSGRSAHGFDLGGYFIKATEAGILEKGGGHKMAGGLTIKPEKVAEFQAYMDNATKDLVRKAERIDARIRLRDIDTHLARGVSLMEPCGNGNPKPRYVIDGCTITKVSWVGKTDKVHLRLLMEDAGVRRSAIVFSAKDTPLGTFLEQSVGKKVSLIGSVDFNPDGYSDSVRINIQINDAVASENVEE